MTPGKLLIAVTVWMIVTAYVGALLAIVTVGG